MFPANKYCRNGSSGAWRRLGLLRPLSPRRSFASPLSSAARRVGGKAAFLELASLSNNPRVQALVYCWNRLSKSDRRYVSLDELCEACGVPPEELYGAVVAAAFANGYNASALIAATFQQVRIIEATIKRGRLPGGVWSRERILKQVGLL